MRRAAREREVRIAAVGEPRRARPPRLHGALTACGDIRYSSPLEASGRRASIGRSRVQQQGTTLQDHHRDQRPRSDRWKQDAPSGARSRWSAPTAASARSGGSATTRTSSAEPDLSRVRPEREALPGRRRTACAATGGLRDPGAGDREPGQKHERPLVPGRLCGHPGDRRAALAVADLRLGDTVTRKDVGTEHGKGRERRRASAASTNARSARPRPRPGGDDQRGRDHEGELAGDRAGEQHAAETGPLLVSTQPGAGQDQGRGERLGDQLGVLVQADREQRRGQRDDDRRARATGQPPDAARDQPGGEHRDQAEPDPERCGPVVDRQQERANR